MAQRMTRKQLLKQDDITETASDVTHWLAAHWQKVAAAAAALVFVAGIVGIWAWMGERSRKQATVAFDAGLVSFEEAERAGFANSPRMESALASFEQAADLAGDRKPGGVARFYQGTTLYRLGRTEEALPILVKLAEDEEDGSTLDGSVKSLLASAWAETGQTEQAVSLLEEVVTANDVGFPADQALMQLGRVQQNAERPELARAAWERIVNEYPQSPAAAEARRLLGP